MGLQTDSGGAGEAQESGGIDLDLPLVSPAPQLANFPHKDKDKLFLP